MSKRQDAGGILVTSTVWYTDPVYQELSTLYFDKDNVI